MSKFLLAVLLAVSAVSASAEGNHNFIKLKNSAKKTSLVFAINIF